MDKTKPILTVQNLRFDAGGKQLLDIDHLTLTSTGPTMILGPNGAGKSLFLRLLHGLIPPKSGHISFGGTPLNAQLRKRQAMVFQHPVLLRRSVAANLSYALRVHKVPKPQRRERVTALLAQANLSGMARQPARTLSGGEQQKLAIVRALANRPDVLFLDEPTSSLDPQSCRDIETLIAQTAQSGTKVIMVTHDIGSAQRNAQDIIFIDKGKVSELTPCKQFFAAPQSERARIFLANRLVL